MWEYALAFACILGINLLPAFGPPTWAVIVFFRLNGDLALVPLVLGGALAAASGRLALAHASRALRRRFSPERIAWLGAARSALTGDRKRAAGGLALFAVSPIPSAQLFVAAGLLAVPLLPLTAVFFAGRLVSYTIYAGGAALAEASLRDTFTDVFGSPIGIGIQILMLLGLVALVRVDWARLLQRRVPAEQYGGTHGTRTDDSDAPRREHGRAKRTRSRRDARPHHRRDRVA